MISGDSFCHAGRFSAGMLDVFQGKSTQHDENTLSIGHISIF